MDVRKLYIKLPQFVKEEIANIEAYKRDSCRRGRLYNDLYNKISINNIFEEDYDKTINQKINEFLEYAKDFIPAYKDLTFKKLPDVPILEKLLYRKNQFDYISSEIGKKELVLGRTSGSSGTPLSFYLSRLCYNYNYLYNDKILEYWGCDLKRNRARCSGVITCDTQKTTPPYWVYIKRYKQLQLSIYNITNDSVKDYIYAINKYKVAFGTGYPSAWISLAKCAIKNDLEAPRIDVIITDSESITETQKKVINKVFGSKVFGTYGTSETGNIAIQCECGNYHINPLMAYVETVDENGRETEEEGDILITTLLDKRTPLFRYRVGDKGILRKGRCQCGLSSQYLTNITGRVEDYVVIDGKKITRLSAPFQKAKNIIAAQIIQDSNSRLLIKYISGDEFKRENIDEVIDDIRLLVGKKIEIKSENTGKLERTANGKVKFIIRKSAG